MIGLAGLTVPEPSWASVAPHFTWPTEYNIAADCLRPDRRGTAVIVVDPSGIRRVSFAELDTSSARLAVGLTAMGLRPGDRVAVKLAQSLEMAISVLAVLRVGGVVLPISNVLGDDGIRHRLRDSAPRIMVAAGSEREAALAAEVDAQLIATADMTGPGRRMSDLLTQATGDARPMVRTTMDSPALLLYTSGTTGKPKGVLHGHRVLLGHHGVNYALDVIRADDVSYSPVDWAWAGGLLLGLLVPLAHGIPVVAYREPRFDVARTLDMMRDCGVSVGLFPPTALRMLRHSEQLTPARAGALRLRCLVTGAEAVEPDLFGWAREQLGVSVNNAFGQTEANALVGHSGVLGELDPACLGKPYPGHDVTVLDESLQPVPAGTPGQIAVRADDPVCMLGYWNAPEATASKIRDGWLLTGDTAHIDERGQFFFHGRSDDIIKSGGYRLGPAEVEAAIMPHPSVAECAVVGLPDPVRGHIVTAFVRLRANVRPGDELTRQLQEQVRAKVGAHAYPRAVRYVSDLPRTTTGKVDRAALRRRADAPAESTEQENPA